jgi:hypothetical protein
MCSMSLQRRRQDKPGGAHEGGPSWDALFEVAASQQGCFSKEQAAEAGFSNQLLHRHLRSGNIQRLHRGIYRLTRFPNADRAQEDLVVAWLWSGRVGVLSHETALQLHGLSDVLPSVIHLTVPSAWSKRRVQPPRGVRLAYDDLRADERTWVGAVPVTTPARAIVEVARDHGDADVIDAARRQALQQGKATFAELDEAVAYLGTSGGPPGPSTVRPETVADLDGTWLTQVVSGTCRAGPKPDWRVAAEEFAAAHGARLLENRFFPRSRTMFIALVWPVDARSALPSWEALRDDAARRFGWVA